MRRLDIAGQKIVQLTVVREAGVDHKGRLLCVGVCDCGGEKTAPASLVKSRTVKTCAEWARTKSISIGALHHRINRGWPIKEALATPVRR